ncbi:family A G protein-coupled receptor-like protein [Sodiomyces alkalinus F11]|uniref:Family A G protein-coupled receptor-like protein n=1 Tax=Sodiomyces alkalinus (strain CBS 110278 / VKM F-3762 / F11) TaxID=1314773 RepID=A0A3N2Q0L3_SODAK|nr:family A G protein-coupled receptor-like protein [Sodiomyces alkalinus F11]ROT40301.1 family A G protein-coupled receptor-like protein [Sodiomyces alkalinus F11]
MGLMLESRNDALDVNGPMLGDQTLTTNGSNWLWAVFSIYALSFLIVIAMSMRPRGGERIFHYIFGITLFAGLIAYFAMASGIAYSVIPQANQLNRGLNRQIYWPKYVFWVVAFPAIAMAVGLVSGVSWATIFYYIALAWIWILSYLFAAFTTTNYKWGFFVFGTVAMAILLLHLFWDGLRGSRRVGVTRDYTGIVAWTSLLWLLYALCWALTDGGNSIGVIGSFIWFGIMDILLIPVVAFLFIFRRWDYSHLNMYFTQYGRVPRGGDYPEKGHAGTAPAGSVPAGNGPAGTTAQGPATGVGAGAPMAGPTAPGHHAV